MYFMYCVLNVFCIFKLCKPTCEIIVAKQKTYYKVEKIIIKNVYFQFSSKCAIDNDGIIFFFFFKGKNLIIRLYCFSIILVDI